MKHIPLKITFKFENGFFKTSNMPFDGVLANAYFEKLKRNGLFNGDYAQELPFLKRTAGAYHISIPVFSPKFVINQTFYKKFDLDLFVKIGDTKKITQAIENPTSGRYKGFVIDNELLSTDEVVIYACGDFDVISDILGEVRFIGKKASLGWGKIKTINIEEIDEDYSMIKDGVLMRQLPDIDLFKISNVGKVIMPLSHPYWKTTRDISLIDVGAISVITEKDRYADQKNHLVINPQGTLARVFGYKSLDKNINGFVENNEIHVCKMCGYTKKEGYLDPKNSLIGDKTNSLYSFADVSSPFLCAECFYNYKNYAKKLQAGKIGDMADIILFEDRFEEKDFLSGSKDNDLYKIFTNPPKPPFVIMLKKLAGTSIVDMGHTIIPTIDKEVIVVHYGLNKFICPRQKTLQCMQDAMNIIDEFNNKHHKVSDDVLFNRQKSESHHSYLSFKLRNNDEFMKKYSEFLTNYDDGIRTVAKIMFNTFKAKNTKIKG